MSEPNIADYYNTFPDVVNVIQKMNEEHHQLMDENEKLKKEINFLKSIFEYHLKKIMLYLTLLDSKRMVKTFGQLETG